jgi:hypothetical protein
MADEYEPRVYGMADEASRGPPASQGLRGERSTTRPSEIEPAFSHTIMLDSGKQVVVSEGSGVAYAEATGRFGRAAGEAGEKPSTSRDQTAAAALLGALVAGMGVGLLAARYLRSSEAEPARLHPAGDAANGLRQVGHRAPNVTQNPFVSSEIEKRV